MRATTARLAAQNAAAAVLISTILHPLDVVKTLKMKTDQKSLPPIAAVRQLIETKGVPAAYAGVGLTACTAAANWGIYRSIYESVGQNSLVAGLRRGRTSVSSTIAAAATICLTYPFYSMKTEMVVKDSQKLSSRQQLTRFVRAIGEGDTLLLKRQFRGLSSMLCTLPTGVLQMVMYERLRNLLPPKPFEGSQSITLQNFARRIFWSSGSKIAATWATYPFQVIRFHQQFPYILEEDIEVEKRSTWRTFKLLVDRKGYSSLFKGFGAHLQKSLAQNVLTLTIYESLSATRR